MSSIGSLSGFATPAASGTGDKTVGDLPAPVAAAIVPPATSYMPAFSFEAMGLAVPANPEDAAALLAMLALDLDKLLQNSRESVAGILAEKLRSLLSKVESINSTSVVSLKAEIDAALNAKNQYEADAAQYQSAADNAKKVYDDYVNRLIVLNNLPKNVFALIEDPASQISDVRNAIKTLADDPDLGARAKAVLDDIDAGRSYADNYRLLKEGHLQAESSTIDKVTGQFTIWQTNQEKADAARENAQAQAAIARSRSDQLSAVETSVSLTRNAIALLSELFGTGKKEGAFVDDDVVAKLLRGIEDEAKLLRERLNELSKKIELNRKSNDRVKFEHSAKPDIGMGGGGPVSIPGIVLNPGAPIDADTGVSPGDGSRPSGLVLGALVVLLSQMGDVVSALSSFAQTTGTLERHDTDDFRKLRG